MTTKFLYEPQEMLAFHETIRELYPEMSAEEYLSRLQDMVKNGYAQLVILENNECLAISGFWINTKLWCGKYLELDNVIVRAKVRSKGVGRLISKVLEDLAKEKNCNILVLDAYTHNYAAHKFYYNQGFGPKGFHFVKVLVEAGIR